MKKLVRLTSALLAVSLLSVLLAIPVAAADAYSGATQVNVAVGNFSSTQAFSLTIPSTSKGFTFNAGSPSKAGFSSWVISDSNGFSSAVGLYFSYYFSLYNSDATIVEYGTPGLSYYKVGGLETSTNTFTYTPVSNVYTFTPAANKSTQGVSIVGRALGVEGDPLKNIGLYAVGSNGAIGVPQSYFSVSSDDLLVMRVTNARAVGVASSAELDALESMADDIAAQNDILQAMYGDLVAICNSIYQKTGDILKAQELANSYFSSMVSILNDIRTTDANIYSLLSSQFAALIAAVETASTDIQAAIAAQTSAIIAYLESIQNVTEIPPSVAEDTAKGEQVRNDLSGLDKPEFTTPDPSDFFTDADAKPFTDVLGQLFGSNLIVTLMLVAFSMAFVGYVLYGKR